MEDKITIKEVKEFYRIFNKERDWEQFHNPKDLAIALSVEAGEIQEHFLWKTNDEINELLKNSIKKQEITDEIADVFAYLILLSDKLNIDLIKAFYEKMEKNHKKYPLEKSKGKHTKYNHL
jgi:NTP pyrophosphatase (non-canonical NTP hydrolase)